MKKLLLFLLLAPLAALAQIKISQLPAATQPLTGGEATVAVQSGTTVQTPVSAVKNYVVQTSLHYGQTSAELAAGVTPTDFGYPPGNVLRYGADPTGAADSTSAIQNAINGLPLTGGIVFLPNGVYKSGTLKIGNGTNSTVSTTSGVTLKGDSLPFQFFAGGFPSSGAVEIKYTGTTGDVIQVQGPLTGWWLENLAISGNATTGNCLHVTSAAFGGWKNLILFNCLGGVLSDTNASKPAGVANIDSLHNDTFNTYIRTTAATPGSYAMKFTSGGSGNSDYWHIYDTFIQFASPSATTYGLWLAAEDNVRFFGVHMSGPSSNVNVLYLDYSVNAGWPADSVITDIDFGGNGGVVANNGVPSGATPNKVVGISSTNGVTANPVLANLLWDVLPNLAGVTGSIGGGALGAGACTSGTVSVLGATTSMVATASPNTYPGDGSYWDAQVTSAGTVTVKVCAAVALTPTASTYNVRVLQ